MPPRRKDKFQRLQEDAEVTPEETEEDDNDMGSFCMGFAFCTVGLMFIVYIAAAAYAALPANATGASLTGLTILVAGLVLTLCVATTFVVLSGSVLSECAVVTIPAAAGVVCTLAFVAALLDFSTGRSAGAIALFAVVSSCCACYGCLAVQRAYNPGKNKKGWTPERQAAWGSIFEQVTAPPDNVFPDETWLAILGMWLFLPINLLGAVMGTVSDAIFVAFSVRAKDSMDTGRGWQDVYHWWRMQFTYMMRFLATRASRFEFFAQSLQAFESSEYYWMNEGVWATSYARVDQIARSAQDRRRAFGAFTAATPELFPSNIVLFMPNTPGDSEWGVIREVLHRFFLDPKGPTYQQRVKMLPAKVGQHWEGPPGKGRLMDNSDAIAKAVARSVFFVAFGVWVDEDEADTLTKWWSYAAFWILPRGIHRFAFNAAQTQVQVLREETVAIVRKYGLEDKFFKANESLPANWRRPTAVQLADELLFALCFAGIGGTSNGVIAVGKFMHGEVNGVPAESVRFETKADDMVALYRADPEAYIKETLRLDMPVTSATSVVKEDFEVPNLGTVRKGTYEQYVLTLANRDPAVFKDPTLFNPKRPELGKALTWNGRAFTKDEKLYPRICPGRNLAMSIMRAVIETALDTPEPNAEP